MLENLETLDCPRALRPHGSNSLTLRSAELYIVLILMSAVKVWQGTQDNVSSK
jgi:hypothetical protein